MTNFDKTKFSYHGGFLMYQGDYEGRPVYEDKPGVHPSRVGTGKDLFIARFKYSGPITKAQFVKELVANHTVEDYAIASTTNTPLDILKDKNPTWYETLIAKYKAKRGIA